jgi:hypothetical protein
MEIIVHTAEPRRVTPKELKELAEAIRSSYLGMSAHAEWHERTGRGVTLHEVSVFQSREPRGEQRSWQWGKGSGRSRSIGRGNALNGSAEARPSLSPYTDLMGRSSNQCASSRERRSLKIASLSRR